MAGLTPSATAATSRAWLAPRGAPGMRAAYNRLFLLYIAIFSASFFAFVNVLSTVNLDLIAAQIPAVEPVEFFGAEYGIGFSYAFQREKLDQFLSLDQFAVVSRRPSQKGKEIDESIRKVSHVCISRNRCCAVTL